ncbi:MAG: ABC transporter permease [Candidatus Nanopelagicales bacterium]|nr:ABC transporter permease [Candidatus Nanopelagicales bacterium]
MTTGLKEKTELTSPTTSETKQARQRVSWAGAALLGMIVPAAMLLLWQWLSTNGSYSASQLPTPVAVGSALIELIERGTFWTHVAISVQRVFLGFALGASAGLALGTLVGLSPRASSLLSPTIQAIRAVPSLAWVPLLVLWMGIYEGPKVTLVAIGAFFPVFTTVASGFMHTDRKLIEVGRAYGLSGLKLASGILLPAAAPTIFAGLRLGLAQSWLFVVAAELIASSKGLGFLLIDSQNTSRTDILFLAIISLAILGKLTDLILATLEKRTLRWT